MENALAADREKQWRAHSSPDSGSESTEGRAITSISRPRSRKASGVAGRNHKSHRKRADTVTSSRTAISRGDSTDTAPGENRSSKHEEARTPTRPDLPITTSGSKYDDALASEAAAAAAAEAAAAAAVDRPRTTTPVTPALTPALTGTTDDSDTDFQSAYSATPSPRESLRGNFEGSDTLHAMEKPIPGSFEAGIVRERVSSVVTAVPQTSPTFSDDTVISGRGAIARR